MGRSTVHVGGGGVFMLDQSDTTTVDDDAMTLVTAAGKPGGGLGVTHNATNRVAYNTGGVVSAAGEVTITGTYWAA